MGRNLFSFIFRGGFLAGAALASSAVLAEGSTAVVLNPGSDWHVDYADDSCRLARTFGEGEQKSIVYLERYEPGDRFFLVAAGAPLKAARDSANTRIRFGPEGHDVSEGWSIGSFGEYDPALIVSPMVLFEVGEPNNSKRGFDPRAEASETDIFGQKITPSQEKSIEWLEISRQGNPPVRFALGSMGEPLAAMRSCTNELMTHWGLDIEAHRNLTRAVAPTTSPATWLRPNDYPTDLLRKGVSGIVQFRLSVDAKGKPAQCHIQRSTRPASFDETVCQVLMRKARFKPALDANGQPIASYWRSAVRFEAPE